MFRLRSSVGLVDAAGGRVDSLAMILLHWARVPARPPPPLTAAWLDMLPEKRRTTLARELGAGRGLESLAGFALLACSAQCMPLPPLSMLAESPGGKPRWPHGPDFSIAHAAGRVI